MVQQLNYLKESASQTAGPYVHIGCTPNFSGIAGVYPEDLGSGSLVKDKTRGERLTIRGLGRVADTSDIANVVLATRNAHKVGSTGSRAGTRISARDSCAPPPQRP